MNKKEFTAINSLKRTSGIGNVKIIDLIRSNKIQDVDVREEEIKIIEEIFNYCYDNNIHIISYTDKNYPQKLRMIPSPPPLLYYRGDIRLLEKNLVAIIGSRDSSQDALIWTREISNELIDNDIVLVSGGAQGIDTAVHNSAIDSDGKTICVLATGLDNVYPKENDKLFNSIENKGLLISEIDPKKYVNRFSLLERNRITSGISDCVLVVTAKINGGAMAQFKTAQSQKKIIFVPQKEFQPNEGIKWIMKNKFAIQINNSYDISKKLFSVNYNTDKNEIIYS